MILPLLVKFPESVNARVPLASVPPLFMVIPATVVVPVSVMV